LEKIILIQAKTNKGKKALEQHNKETAKIGIQQKLIFKAAGYSQKIINTNPVILELTIRNNQIQKPLFLQLMIETIGEALKENGAEKDKDYRIEVK
jgi:ABC-type proline/glycine betaine transport system substrate-binding protein